MIERVAGFTGEYLWELDIAEHHLRAVAAAIPAERYDWRPAVDARSVSQVFMHIAAGNFALLDMAGVEPPADLYPLAGAQGTERFFALIMRNLELEKRVTSKADVTRFLDGSLAATRHAFTRARTEDLDRGGEFFGEQTTVRRVYLRLLAHTHEHMGQVISYVRAMGLKAPWPDPLEMIKAEAGAGESPRAAD